MEQYLMPKELDFENLRFCIDNYSPALLYIRLVGSVAAARGVKPEKVRKNLKDKTLDFRKDDSGLYMLVDSEEVFHFPLKNYNKGFSLTYERIRPTKDGIGRIVMLSAGFDPYDPDLPEPKSSTLRTVLDDHLMEIKFKGRIDLKFHSWMYKPDWKYWTVDKSKEKN